jgi:hypothetical protein
MEPMDPIQRELDLQRRIGERRSADIKEHECTIRQSDWAGTWISNIVSASTRPRRSPTMKRTGKWQHQLELQRRLGEHTAAAIAEHEQRMKHG